MNTIFRVALILGLAGQYDRGIARGVAAFARPGTPWVFEFVRPDVASIRALRRWKPDGIIASLISDDLAEEVSRFQSPTISVADAAKPDIFPRVNSDHHAVGAAGAMHLLNRGFRNFAFLGWPHHEYSDQREKGFIQTVMNAGCRCHQSRESLAIPHWKSGRWRGAVAGLSRWLHHLPKPVGVMACNDYFGWRVAEICYVSGIRVPEELALIGADNDEVWCNLSFPSLSSVITATEHIGYEAAVMLAKMLSGENVAPVAKFLPPTGVVTRASSDVLAIDDEELATVIRYIRGHAHQLTCIDDLAAASTLSRRSLERRCREVLGRSPAEEVRRVRIEKAMTLLVHTDLAMPAIAKECGFSSANRLYSIFTRITGRTPTAYRRDFGSLNTSGGISPGLNHTRHHRSK